MEVWLANSLVGEAARTTGLHWTSTPSIWMESLVLLHHLSDSIKSLYCTFFSVIHRILLERAHSIHQEHQSIPRFASRCTRVSISSSCTSGSSSSSTSSSSPSLSQSNSSSSASAHAWSLPLSLTRLIGDLRTHLFQRLVYVLLTLVRERTRGEQGCLWRSCS